MKHQALRAILAVVPCLALVIGFISIRPTLRTQAASFDSHHLVNTSQITCGQWNLIPNTAQNSALFGVAGISVNDVWAVGSTNNPNNRQPLTMHWDGTSWSSVPSPVLTGTSNEFNAVAAISTSDVWAVGVGNSPGGNGSLIEHWDGTSWSVVPSPNAGISSVLYSVTSIPGTNQLWAVGYYSDNNSNYPLIEFWDGTQWNVVSSPPVNGNGSGFQSVTAFSPTDAWVVGWFDNPSPTQTLTEHWDGTSWSVVPSPNHKSSDTVLFSVTTVPNSNEVWAVGYYSHRPSALTLTEHWDGSAWNVVKSPNFGRGNELLGTTATATNDVWSVGTDNYGKALIEQWNGSKWSIVSQPASKLWHSVLWSIAAVPNQTDIWAVGYHYSVSDKMYHPLTMLYC